MKSRSCRRIARVCIPVFEGRLALVTACLLGLFATPATPATAATVGTGIWPLKNGSHQMLNGFADGTPNNTYQFHEGIDIMDDGKGGQDVVVMRKGKVVLKDAGGANDNGYVTIEVDLGGGMKEWDSYVHIKPLDNTKYKLNDVVDAGADLGTISTKQHPEGRRHLHVDVNNALPPADGSAAPEQNYLNPFMRFAANADRDPLGNSPGLNDSNGDGKTLLVFKSGTLTPVDTKAVKGNVDLAADARDKMNNNVLQAANPYKVGYWVESLFNIGVPSHGVGTAALPYNLATFDDAWFAGKPKTNGKFPAVYAYNDTLKVNPAPPGGDYTKHFLVTNATTLGGLPSQVDANQFWNTDAKDDPGIADYFNSANFAGLADATKNAEARFKDGDYLPHILLEDLVNEKVDAKAGKLRLDNFKQDAKAAVGGAAPPAYVEQEPLYDFPSFIPFVVGQEPEPTVPSLLGSFQMGQDIGVSGAQYYPSLLLPAYVLPHKAQWLEGDFFVDELAKILVSPDASGLVALTKIWKANKRGQFDLIIDYDRDAVFSWTLDGLSSFMVVPEPAALGLGLAAVGLVVRRRRRPPVPLAA